MLIGRNQWVIDAAIEALESPAIKVYGALNAKETVAVLNKIEINHAFVGPGLELNIRLKIIRSIFTISSFTTVHLKDHSTGPEGALNFVRGILKGLDEIEKN